MKRKVAFFATSVCFLLLVLFVGVVAGNARNALDASALSELEVICRLSAFQLEATQKTETSNETAAIRKMATSTGVVFALYSESGETLYTNRPQISDTLSSEERAACKDSVVRTFVRQNSTARSDWLYAATRSSDGAFLVVSRPAFTLADALGHNLLAIVLLAMGFAALVYCLLYLANHRSERLIASVLRVMEDFSEGQFDSRISSSNADSIEQATKFNDVMGRLQERVFRQKTRNDALGTVLNHMQNGILAVDDSLIIILVTPAAKRMLGIAGSAEGLPIQMASKDVKIDHLLREAMLHDGVYTNEVAARTTTGRGHRPLRLYVSPMMKDGRAVGAVALIEDITELRRLEQVRTDFAANVSHELKTPLTSIKGFVETLQNGAIDRPDMAQKFLSIIMLEADRLTRLINDILTVTKLESGSDSVPVERLRLDERTRDVVEMLRMLASEKQITINCNIGGPCAIMGNPDRVEQMLINLIENAIKYNKVGGTVTVSLFSAEDTCNLSISDTGIGIPEENIPRLFERFYRVDKGRSRSMGGTGLGLSIVKHIVKTMDGMIEVHSKLGEGTEFLITLPRVAAESDTPVEQQFDRPGD